MAAALIALGGNLGDVISAFRRARTHLQAHAGPILKSSRLYRTQPLELEPDDAPLSTPKLQTPAPAADYLNAACLLDTHLKPLGLLALLQKIEHMAGRRRTLRWASRQLDLDMLAYGQQRICTPGLIVPHPHLRQRAFVLYPLVDIAPDFALPPDDMTPRQLLHALPAPHVGVRMQAAMW